jgi:hypothetical protein
MILAQAGMGMVGLEGLMLLMIVILTIFAAVLAIPSGVTALILSGRRSSAPVLVKYMVTLAISCSMMCMAGSISAGFPFNIWAWVLFLPGVVGGACAVWSYVRFMRETSSDGEPEGNQHPSIGRH